MAGDDAIIPLQERIETVDGEADWQEIYATERHWLYAACTPAGDSWLVTHVEPASALVDDLQEGFNGPFGNP